MSNPFCNVQYTFVHAKIDPIWFDVIDRYMETYIGNVFTLVYIDFRLI